MKIEYYHVDAFTNSVFGGNPAGVCLLEKPMAEEVMQKIAAENNLSETAFVWLEKGTYQIRWFSPATEVDLCGHATLASAHVLLNRKGLNAERLEFQSKTDRLSVQKENGLLYLDFPARTARACHAPTELLTALILQPLEVLASVRDYLVIYPTEETVKRLNPNMDRLKQIDKFGVIVSAPGEKADFVSRFFCPGAGIAEDPVTGSSHCTLIPYWSKKSGKTKLQARQVSARGGELMCQNLGERVRIGGQAVIYCEGKVEI
jgi:PhzF family phenazine biosynthesis protein